MLYKRNGQGRFPWSPASHLTKTGVRLALSFRRCKTFAVHSTLSLSTTRALTVVCGNNDSSKRAQGGMLLLKANSQSGNVSERRRNEKENLSFSFFQASQQKFLYFRINSSRLVVYRFDLS